MTDHARVVASELLRIGAVALRPLEPFTWASGRLSPIYTDNRLTIGFPTVRQAITDAFVEVAQSFAPSVIVGTATAGIPHAAWLADRLDLPLAYVRSAAKDHGTQSLVEGVVRPADRALIIEDLVSTGGSSLAAARALRDAGADVLGVLAVFTYGFPEALAAFEQNGLFCTAITDFETLLFIAEERGRLSSNELELLRAWHADPIAWSAARSGRG